MCKIFDLYIQGNEVCKIKRYLEEHGIKMVTGKSEWSASTIDRMLSNEKYTGDVILGKTHVVDGVQVKCHDINKQVLIRGHHPAIISHELFRAVQ